ncbi:MAG TPA: MFS transporter [Aliidongia sp.]|uniref:MFS transporter n=1 Tax=Aliidongia sp. TaxID=1914230 RepID=UPI002DDD7776|nr:MFS transporter [Aliidongia sp.]HEV2675119.1 MFS transporter [Aliidongia sp.]
MATTNYVDRPESGAAVSAADEKRLFARIAWRVLPLLTIAYIINFIDRTNVGFAALTMNKEIGLTATQFGYGAGVLFIGYCLFEVPSNVALYRLGARIWLARILISWGLISMATVFVTGPWSFYLLRFLLGAAEAGFFPGAAFYLTLWFPREYRARIYAWFLVAIPASSVIGGPLSGALLELDGWLGLAGWKWLFLAEGLPAVAMGVLLLVLMVDTPQKAKFLNAAEREFIVRRLAAEPKERERRNLWESLRDGRVLTLALVQFTYTVGAYGVAIFLPLILKEQHFTNVVVGWLTALANLFACIIMIVWAGFIDRRGKAVFNLAITCLVSGLGLVLAITVHSFIPAFIGLTIAVVGTSTARAVLWTIPTRFLTGLAAAGGLALINSVGIVGGFVGPSIMGVMKDLSGSFDSGLIAMAGFLFVATVLALSTKRYIARE